MKYLSAFVIIFILVISCKPQRRLHLEVQNSDLQALPYAKVRLENNDTSFVGETDFEGKLTFRDVRVGKYQLGVSFPGYYPLNEMDINIKDENKIIIEMQETSIDTAANITWEGGWMTYKDKNGNIRYTRIDSLQSDSINH